MNRRVRVVSMVLGLLMMGALLAPGEARSDPAGTALAVGGAALAGLILHTYQPVGQATQHPQPAYGGYALAVPANSPYLAPLPPPGPVVMPSYTPVYPVYMAPVPSGYVLVPSY